jgi:hypothetical protein
MLDRDRVDIVYIASTMPVAKNIESLRGAGISINLPTPVWDERTKQIYLRVGNQIYYSGVKRRTFHEILIDHLNTMLGKEWITHQEGLPEHEWNFIYKCFKETDKYFHSGGINMHQENEELRSGAPNGYVQSLLTLAFDVYLLKSAGSLEDKVFNRLKKNDQYQGARYEITVAASFIKVGWSIEWVKDMKGVSIPEFMATSPDEKYKVAVEAKSKHRDGVLHKGGVFDAKSAEKGSMLYLFKEALGKATFDLPYIIFLDLNSPQTIAKKDHKHWMNDLVALFNAVDPTDPAKRIDKQNLVISTNFAPHYDGRNIATGGQYVVAYSLNMEHPIPKSYLDGIVFAVSNVQSVPTQFPNHIK